MRVLASPRFSLISILYQFGCGNFEEGKALSNNAFITFVMPQERSCIMLRFAELLEKHNDEIAALATWDNGKPYEQAALVEVPMAVRLFHYYAGRCSIAKSYVDEVT